MITVEPDKSHFGSSSRDENHDIDTRPDLERLGDLSGQGTIGVHHITETPGLPEDVGPYREEGSASVSFLRDPVQNSGEHIP